MSARGEMWLDREAGPVVRPYALTRGRTRPQGVTFGLIDMVTAAGAPASDALWLRPEHGRLLDLCQKPITVADLVSEIDLPLGVVRVLLGDLREQGLITLAETRGGQLAEESVMRSLLEGLRAL